MKPLILWILVLVIIISGILGVFFFRESAFDNPFQENYVFDFPVFATGDAFGNHYVIDTAFRRVSKISPDQQIVYQINGGFRDNNRFFYVQQIAVNNQGYLFLLDETRDEKGFYVLRERILLYSPTGVLLGVLYEENYPEGHNDPTLVQRNRIIGLDTIGNDTIQFFVLTNESLISRTINFTIHNGVLNEEALNIQEGIVYPFPDALFYISDATLTENGPVTVLRDGTIRLLNRNSNATILFSGQSSENNQERIVPWEVATTNSGQLYFVDLEHRAIRSIDGSILLNRDIIAENLGIDDLYNFDYYRVDVSVLDNIYTTNDSGVVIHENNGNILFIDSANITALMIIPSILWWFSILLIIIGVIILLWLLYSQVFKRVLPSVLLQAGAVIVLVTIVGGISTFLLIDNFNSRYIDVILQRISQLIQVLPLVIDGDAYENITEQEDYGNDDYQSIRNQLLTAFNQNKGSWNEGYYFATYKILDERLYGFMYLNGNINTYYPFDWLGGVEDPGIYDLAYQGEIGTEMIRDITGEWIYGVGPILNSNGEVVGIFETGTDLYTLTVENRRLINNLVWELVTVWIVLMLLLVEITVLTSLLRERNNSHIPLSIKDTTFSDGNLARPLIFLYFTAVSFSIAFLPILSKNLFDASAGLSELTASTSQDINIALPLSLEMAFFGIATVFTGLLTNKIGWRNIFSLSLLIVSVGLLLSGLARSYNLFLVARSLTGLASGMGYIALRSFINLEGRIELRNKAYSNFYSGMVAGINVGLVLGASLSALIGYSNVFYIGLVIIIITSILFFTLYKDTKFFWTEASTVTMNHFKALISLIKAPRLWMYFIFLVLPTYVAASYVIFYFPLFAETNLNLDTPQVGRFLIMHGLFIVYLGPILSRFVEKKIGTYWGSILGSLSWGVAVIIAGFIGNALTAALVLILMGITEGFAVSNQNGLYFSEKTTDLVGQDRATGYFELFGKIGDAIGPIIFATVLILGRTQGLLILGILVAALTIPYILFVRNTTTSKG